MKYSHFVPLCATDWVCQQQQQDGSLTPCVNKTVLATIFLKQNPTYHGRAISGFKI